MYDNNSTLFFGYIETDLLDLWDVKFGHPLLNSTGINKKLMNENKKENFINYNE